MTATISWQDRILWICNTVFHQSVAVAGVVILWILSIPYDISALYRWHTILTTLAYVPLMAEAIVLFGTSNVWTQGIPRTTRYSIHGAFLFLSAILASVGIGFMINIHHGTHFESRHAITGLISWIFVLLSQFLGAAAAQSMSLKHILRPVWFKLLHNLFGMLGYILGIVSLCDGIQKRVFIQYTSDNSRLALTILLGFIGMWTLLAALQSFANQIKSVIKD